jgi:hemerythrin-like domain-containing protein
MKRINQLLPLSKEHHLSLTLAKKCKDILVRESKQVIRAFSLELKADFDLQWKNHFSVEEETIFNLAQSKGEDIAKLCHQLKQEHHQMEVMVKDIAQGNVALLHDFGELLHDHTRCEERVLFPMVETLFTEIELNTILEKSQ